MAHNISLATFRVRVGHCVPVVAVILNHDHHRLDMTLAVAEALSNDTTKPKTIAMPSGICYATETVMNNSRYMRTQLNSRKASVFEASGVGFK